MSLAERTTYPFQPARVASLRAASEPLSDRIFFWCLFVFVSLSPHIREYGGALLFVFLAIEVVYVIWSRSFVFYVPLTAFTSLGLLYVVLSYYELLPDAWARFNLAWAIPQQASFLAILYPTVLAARQQWRFLSQAPSAPWRIAALAFAGGVISHAVAPDFIASDYRNFFLSPGNAGFFMFFAASYFLFLSPRSIASGLALCLVLLGIVLAPQLQAQLLYLLIFVLLFSPWPRLVVAGWCATLVAMYFLAFAYPVWIWDIDPNSGIRAFFARDALEALWDSGGIGVGFGKEAIKNYYSAVGHLHTDWHNRFDAFIMIGVHNSFTAMFYRLGIIGGLLWLWVAVVKPFPRAHAGLPERRFYSAIFGTMFIATFTNVGLESPTFSPAVAFAIGILLSERDRALERNPLRTQRI